VLRIRWNQKLVCFLQTEFYREKALGSNECLTAQSTAEVTNSGNKELVLLDSTIAYSVVVCQLYGNSKKGRNRAIFKGVDKIFKSRIFRDSMTINNPCILFFSQRPPENLHSLAESLPLVHVRQSNIAVSNIEALMKRLRESDPLILVIDAHYGDADMQYLGEIASLEARGIEAMRSRVAKGKNIPDSFVLLRLVQELRPGMKIIFVLHKAPKPNMVKLLIERGANLVIDNNRSVMDITGAVTELLKSVTAMGQTFVKNSARVGAAAKDLFEKARP
jgi:hypothetical protein